MNHGSTRSQGPRISNLTEGTNELRSRNWGYTRDILGFIGYCDNANENGNYHFGFGPVSAPCLPPCGQKHNAQRKDPMDSPNTRHQTSPL